jgi:hypothetical protein
MNVLNSHLSENLAVNNLSARKEAMGKPVMMNADNKWTDCLIDNWVQMWSSIYKKRMT